MGRRGPEWTSIAALAAGGPALEARLAVHSLDLPERTRHAWFVEKAAWYVAAVAGQALVKGERVPRLDGEAIWLRFDADGMPDGIDADGGGADDRGVGGAIAGLLDGLIRALVARGPARARSLWRHAADRVADGLLWSGEACGDPAAGRALAEAAAAPGTPLAISLRFDAEGGLWRVSCCLSYRLEGEVTCVNCPRRAPRSRRT
jgi:ferric iron reductase protein FhuF